MMKIVQILSLRIPSRTLIVTTQESKKLSTWNFSWVISKMNLRGLLMTLKSSIRGKKSKAHRLKIKRRRSRKKRSRLWSRGKVTTTP